MTAGPNFSIAKKCVTLLVFLVGAFALIHYSKKLFQLPLVDDYCIKPALHIGVATEMYKHGDPWVQHVPYLVEPKNWNGETWPIIAFDSPLTIVGLSGLFEVLKPKSFENRVEIARYFALAHVVAAYLVLVGGLYLLGDFLGILLIGPLICGSFFIVYYSSRPFAEEYALFYQALLALGGWYILNSTKGIWSKLAWIFGLAALLCVGGKMNYFTLIAPLILFLPEIAPGLAALRVYRKKAVLAVAVTALAAIPVLFFFKFPFATMARMFVFGNVMPVPGQYFSIFIRGFLELPSIFKRTFEDFGFFVFIFGWLGLIRLTRMYFVVRSGHTGLYLPLYQRILLALSLGHVLNYLVLRNLYVPHGYYLLPGFIIAALLAVDFLNWVLHCSFVQKFWWRRATFAAVILVLLVASTRSQAKKYNTFWNLRDYYQKSIIPSEALRKLTKPDEVIFAGNICFAFYADRLAVVNPHREWIDQYIAHGMRYYLSDPDPNMNHFFHLEDKQNQIFRIDDEFINATH